MHPASDSAEEIIENVIAAIEPQDLNWYVLSKY